MSHCRAPLIAVACAWGILIGLTAPLRAEDAAEKWTQRFREQVAPIFAARCNACHGEKEPQAELNLARLSEKRLVEHLALWVNVAQRVRDGEMPPEESEPLTEAEKTTLLEWIAAAPQPENCEQLATDENTHFFRGYVMSRRITRYEYDNCIRDLTGLDLHLARDFPSDGSGGEGFDTTGDALFTSPILLEKYLEAADKILAAALPDSDQDLAPKIAAARARLLIATPSDSLAPRDAARRIVADFARRAYRRPIEEAEVDRLLTLYDAAEQRGESFVPAVRHMLKAVLISPNFLFLAEPEPAKVGVYRLGPYELATRLSFFIWSSLPDEELHALAASGDLHQTEVIRAQVRRMLKDPRARALGENFGAQWLGLGELGRGKRPDGGHFPEFDAALADAMREEAIALVHGVFRHDRPLRDLLTADYTYLNERLAAHYKIEGVSGAEFRQVSLSDPRRGGLLTMAGVLTVTSYPHRTSPVLRGQWVLQEILGSRVPPPPPNVPALDEQSADDKQLTLRARLEKHRQDPSCAACHARMDPLGFGLENFDAIGRWRDTDAGQPIDAQGKLAGGETFNGPADLKTKLLGKKREVYKTLSRKMLSYALGRDLNRFDDCVIDDALEALEANDDRASVLVEQIVLSYPFQHRYFKK